MDSIRSTSNASQSSSSELSCSELSSFGSEFGDPLEHMAKEVKQQPYTTYRSLQRLLERLQQALEQDKTRDQYLVFTSVPPAQFSKLSRSQTRKHCRFSYNIETGILIAKAMIMPTHVAAGEFDVRIVIKLAAMNVLHEITACRSTIVTAGNWQKGADCSWAPAETHAGLSFVVEVGLSESAQRLVIDAHGWLENSSSVKLVVTMTIGCDNAEIILRRWELFPRRSGILTRASPHSAQCTAFVKISRTNNTTSVTGASTLDGITTMTKQLVLPFDKVMNRPPNQPLERDIVITQQDLEGFAEKLWLEQGLL
ncbi:hypothetical protein BJX63DRAFT_395124 [Aspergillus granulosus]|uniref:Uncharacterized protein n=1 Tax=Aspergillus granulosus TaxID=176169 RepID=A0ABR4HCF0_9EURO